VPNEPRGGRRSLLGLNAAVVRAGREWRPDVTLALHVAATPAARLLRARHGIPYVAYIHAKEARLMPYATAAAMPRAARVIVVSRYARALALEAGADPDRVRQVSPGVDLPPAHRRTADAVPTLVTVSRLEDRNKGHDVVLDALPRIAERVPSVRWVVIGDGPLRPELERVAAARGVAERVTFAGALSDADRDAWLDRAALYVMPTRVPADGRGGEGFGMVYVEAAARGLPSVASRVPGVVDAVRDGATGLLVAPEQPAALADAVVGLLEDGPRLAALGEAARARAEELSWDRVAGRAAAVLGEAVEAAGGRPRLGRRRLRRALWPADLLVSLQTPRPFAGRLPPGAGL
jgi:phosphatidylinositol alpha-1,6-mannosyltransferase